MKLIAGENMKGFFKSALCVMLSALILMSAVLCADAEESSPDNAPVLKDIVVSSGDIGSMGFSRAVQTALDFALTDSSSLRVTVAPGDYTLDSALHIYGNTTLVLYGVTITRGDGAQVNMLRTGDDETSSTGVTGYFYENISIEGGTFDAALTQNTLIKVAHAKNFIMKDVTVKNAKNYHMMEVAGVDGFTLDGCEFSNQELDKEASPLCYEAVQLDVLISKHIVNCRSEDLPMKNVLVENCTFDKCPRGVGSHTSILNRPHENIVIKNNTFTNMSSAAIQLLGCKNCSITENYIENTPRAIAVYSTATKGRGTFLPSDFSKEGGTETHADDDYHDPVDSNTLIAYNTIKKSGAVKDIYADYSVASVSVMGREISYEENEEKRLPEGDYYMTGVTVRDNNIEAEGTGIRSSGARNVSFCSNILDCQQSTIFPDKGYSGISLKQTVGDSFADDNYIKSAQINGVYSSSSELSSVSGNTVSIASKSGIKLEGVKARIIERNTVSNCAVSGIALLDSSSVESPVNANRVASCATGMHLSQDSSAEFCCNTITNYKDYMRFTTLSENAVIGRNYDETVPVNEIVTDISSLELSVGKTYLLKANTYPVNSYTALSYSSSNPEVASVDESGCVTAESEGEADITLQSENGKTATVKVVVTAQQRELSTSDSEVFTSVLTVSNVMYGVKTTWDKVENAVSYHLFRKTDSAWTRIAETEELSFVDKYVVSGGTYAYTVRAVGEDGNYIGSYDTAGSVITYVAPAVISKLENTVDKTKISWNPVAGAAYYRIYFTADNQNWKLLYTTKKTTKSLKGVVSGVDYRYIIVCLDENKCPLNFFNRTGWDRMFLSKPSLKNKTNEKKITLNWSQIQGAKFYIVMAKGSGNWKKIKATTLNSFTYNGKYDKKYTFLVRGLDGSGRHSSVYSNYSYATPKMSKKLKKLLEKKRLEKLKKQKKLKKLKVSKAAKKKKKT